MNTLGSPHTPRQRVSLLVRAFHEVRLQANTGLVKCFISISDLVTYTIIPCEQSKNEELSSGFSIAKQACFGRASGLSHIETEDKVDLLNSRSGSSGFDYPGTGCLIRTFEPPAKYSY